MSQVAFQLVTQKEVDAVIEGTFKVMEEVGQAIYQPDAVRLLKEAGCEVDGERVKIPRKLVKKCIDSAPNVINIYDRHGNPAMALGERNAYFGPGPTCINFFDPRTGEHRPSKKQDAADAARVADALPDMDFVMSLVMISDTTKSLADVHEVDAMVRNTTKPIVTWSFNKDNAKAQIDICAAIAGGLDKLAEKPFMIMYVEPASPLLHTKEPVEVLMECAKLGIPCVYTPGSLIGATVPATLPGAMTVSMSESLTGLVIAQLINPGTPIVCAGHGGAMNLKTMNHCYGMIESPMYNGLGAECMHRLGLPAWHLAGATDSKVIDGQAVSDAVFQTVIALGTGGNLIHDVGFADGALTGSIEYLVICDELIGMAKRLFRGIDFDDMEDAFAFDVIKEVGPQGNFLLEDHTLDHCYDFYDTSIMDYNHRAKWTADGCKSMTDRAQDKMRKILDTHEVAQLPADVLAEIDRIVAAAEERVAGKA